MSLFTPTKPPFSPPTVPVAMTAGHELTRSTPQQALFDMDSKKFLIDSGASVHMWSKQTDFVSYEALTKPEQECEQVLGVNGATTKPLGIGTVKIKVEDNLKHSCHPLYGTIEHVCATSCHSTKAI